MKTKTNETNVSMDIDTFNKVRGKLKPTDNVTLSDDKSVVSSSSTSVTEEDAVEPEAIIEPQDNETIKYLSNVKDTKTGEISKPFTIGDKRYQMVRGITPSKEIVMGVYCHDDMDGEGNNIIHSVDYFDENIATPFKIANEQSVKESGYDYAGEERRFADQEAFMDYLNLADLVGYKHFFVNIRTGEIVDKFKKTSEMVKSGIKLGPDEDYMDIKSLKKFRFGDYFKNDVSEEINADDAGTNLPKLQSDVKKLTALIKNKFSVYLSKLDKPIEQAQFLTAMAAEIGVPLNKLNTIITSYKDISKDGDMDKTNTAGLTAENTNRKVIKTIKVKDIK